MSVLHFFSAWSEKQNSATIGAKSTEMESNTPYSSRFELKTDHFGISMSHFELKKAILVSLWVPKQDKILQTCGSDGCKKCS